MTDQLGQWAKLLVVLATTVILDFASRLVL
jgi:hypothetical protein